MYNEKLYTVAISISDSGDNTILPAPGLGVYYAIDHINGMPTTAVTVTLKDGATARSGGYPLDAKQPLTLENTMHNQDGLIQMTSNSAFIINLGGGVAFNGFVSYRVKNNS